MNHSRTRAFTLLELSIVITILGLLVGGIMAGQTMIRSSELNSVLKDATNYVFAVGNFKQQYRALPGDYLTAETTWGAANTDNGDGSTTITAAERYLAWQHLKLAGFIEKSVTGAQGAGGASDFVIGSNIPDSKLKNGGFALYYGGNTLSPVAATATSFADALGNKLTYGAHVGTNSGPPINVIMTPVEAYSLDTKADDGAPGTGKWLANGSGGTNFGAGAGCASSNASTATYNLTLSTIQCSFFIATGY